MKVKLGFCLGLAMSLVSSLALSNVLSCSNGEMNLTLDLGKMEHLVVDLDEQAQTIQTKIKGHSFNQSGVGALVAEDGLLVISAGANNQLQGELSLNGYPMFYNLDCELN